MVVGPGAFNPKKWVITEESAKLAWAEFRYKVESCQTEIQHQVKQNNVTKARLEILRWVIEIMPSE